MVTKRASLAEEKKDGDMSKRLETSAEVKVNNNNTTISARTTVVCCTAWYMYH